MSFVEIMMESIRLDLCAFVPGLPHNSNPVRVCRYPDARYIACKHQPDEFRPIKEAKLMLLPSRVEASGPGG
jgi:hypothetical protein